MLTYKYITVISHHLKTKKEDKRQKSSSIYSFSQFYDAKYANA